MIVMPTTYSPMTVARSFQLVEEFELSGRVLHVIYDSQTPRAAIIEADIETFDGVPRHRVVAALDLQRKAQLGKDIVAVERCWEDANLVQVEGICVAPGERDKGLATRLYEALILQCGITLVSGQDLRPAHNPQLPDVELLRKPFTQAQLAQALRKVSG